jgi:hypothetical protein
MHKLPQKQTKSKTLGNEHESENCSADESTESPKTNTMQVFENLFLKKSIHIQALSSIELG